MKSELNRVAVHVRLHPLPWRLVRQDALDQGISAAEWIRRLVDDYFTLHGTIAPDALTRLDEKSRRGLAR